MMVITAIIIRMLTIDIVWISVPSMILKRISYNVLGMLTPSSVAGMQLIMWGENMIALVVGWVGECCSEHS